MQVNVILQATSLLDMLFHWRQARLSKVFRIEIQPFKAFYGTLTLQKCPP